MQTPEDVLADLIRRYPRLAPCQAPIEAAGRCIVASLEQGGTLFTCGNGGSAADAEHLVGELLKKFCQPRPVPDDLRQRLEAADPEIGAYLSRHLEAGLRAVALTSHPSLTTAMANDVASDVHFAQQLLALGRPGDVLLGISTSGQAVNVAHAMRVARALDIRVIGLTGDRRGPMVKLCDIAIEAPESSTPHIQELHLPIYHALCRMVENHFFATPFAPSDVS